MQATYDGRLKRQRQAAVSIDQPILDGAHAFSAWAMQKRFNEKGSKGSSLPPEIYNRFALVLFTTTSVCPALPASEGFPTQAFPEKTMIPAQPSKQGLQQTLAQLGPGFSVTSMAERGTAHYNHIRRCDKMVNTSGNKSTSYFFLDGGDFLMMNCEKSASSCGRIFSYCKVR